MNIEQRTAEFRSVESLRSAFYESGSIPPFDILRFLVRHSKFTGIEKYHKLRLAHLNHQ